LADDERAVIDTIGPKLLKAGFQVVYSYDGDLAYDLAVLLCPSAIVLDEQMPGLKGSEICARLAANPETAGIPIIILSGYGKIAGCHPNVVKHIEKPFSAKQVVEAVASLVKRSAVAA